MRRYLGELFRLYNYYVPEVLLGKCFGRYLTETYPERAFYEYPILLLGDIFEAVVDYSLSQDQTELKQKVNQTDLDFKQNEIPQTEQDHYFPKETLNNEANSLKEETSIFNLSDVLLSDKDSVIDDAVSRNSWKKCVKLYTAESILRKLKLYFLN